MEFTSGAASDQAAEGLGFGNRASLGYRSLGLTAREYGITVPAALLGNELPAEVVAILNDQATRWRNVPGFLGMPERFEDAPEFPVPAEALEILGLDISAENQAMYCDFANVEHPDDMAARYEVELARKKAQDKATAAESAAGRQGNGVTEEMFGGDPIPLSGDALPPFPTDALPPVYDRMTTALAHEVQVDEGMVGAVMLACLAAACNGAVEAEPRPRWREPANLFVGVVADPAERKSAVMSNLTKPLFRAEEKLLIAARPARAEAETRQAITRKRADAAIKAAADAVKTARGSVDSDTDSTDPFDNPEINAVELAKQAEEIEIPPLTQLIADDVTTEALGSLMAENRGRMAIMSAEGGVFDILAGKYTNKVPSLDVWLKGHAGDSHRVKRMGRAEIIARPALTVALMFQMRVLEKFTTHEDFRGLGLLARFAFCLPPSKLGHRDTSPVPAPEAVEAEYTAALLALALDMQTRDETVILKFDDGATIGLDELMEFVEPQLVGDGAFSGRMKAWGGKFSGLCVRLAETLHMATHGPEGAALAISADTFARARRLGEYFAAHAAAALAPGAGADNTDVAKLLAKVQALYAKTGGPVALRDVQRSIKPEGLRKKGALDSAIRTLETNHLVYAQRFKNGRVLLHLHPKLIG